LVPVLGHLNISHIFAPCSFKTRFNMFSCHIRLNRLTEFLPPNFPIEIFFVFFFSHVIFPFNALLLDVFRAGINEHYKRSSFVCNFHQPCIIYSFLTFRYLLQFFILHHFQSLSFEAEMIKSRINDVMLNHIFVV
jgi:hypothetical protein